MKLSELDDLLLTVADVSIRIASLKQTLDTRKAKAAAKLAAKRAAQRASSPPWWGGRSRSEMTAHSEALSNHPEVDADDDVDEFAPKPIPEEVNVDRDL